MTSWLKPQLSDDIRGLDFVFYSCEWFFCGGYESEGGKDKTRGSAKGWTGTRFRNLLSTGHSSRIGERRFFVVWSWEAKDIFKAFRELTKCLFVTETRDRDGWTLPDKKLNETSTTGERWGKISIYIKDKASHLRMNLSDQSTLWVNLSEGQKRIPYNYHRR